MAEYNTADLRRVMGTGGSDLMSGDDQPKKRKRDWRSDIDAPGGIPTGGPRRPDLMTEAGPYDPARSVGERAMAGLLDYGPLPARMATAIAMQPIRAGEAIGEAAAVPSIPNITKAGVETAMAAMPLSPARALRAGVGALAGGYGAAIAKDTNGLGLMASASAAGDGLNDAQRKRLSQLQRKGSLSRAEREEQNSYLAIQARQQEIAAQSAAKERELVAQQDAARVASERQEYDRAVSSAEAARAAEFAKDRSFKDSEAGKVYEKTGGFAPLLMGVGAGMAQRLAAGPGKTMTEKYLIPAAEGAGLTFAGLNAPLLYDAYNTPTQNPKRAGEETYARMLPPNHPRKAEAMAYAQSILPIENPVMRQARDEFTDPVGIIKRGVGAILEGAPAGILGAKLPDAGRATLRGVGAVPGAIAEGYATGMGRAAIARGDAAAAARVAAQERLAAAEVQRRLGGQTAGAPPAGTVPGMPGGQPPPPAPLQSQSLPSPPPNQMGANIPAPATSNQGLMAPPIQQPQQMLAMPPEVMDLVRKIGDRMDATAAPRAISSGAGKPGRVGWANTWSSPARDAVLDKAKDGVPLNAITARELRDDIIKRLPAGVKPPSEATVREYKSRLAAEVGSAPSVDVLKKTYKNNPGLFAVPAGAAGLGLMGDYPTND